MARKENTNNAGVIDDALATDVGSGGKLPVHGVVIDSLGHSFATHLLPMHVRNVLFRLLDKGATHPLPLYDDNNRYDATTRQWEYAPSAASALAVTTSDAEHWKSGDSARMAMSKFALYADRPLNETASSRANFWSLHPNAAELDAAMLLEPQKLIFDAASQLFMESASFHFGYLADIDAEYHRMRDVGPLGRYNDASVKPAWHNLYHYWRDIVERDYLDTGAVVLPAGLRGGNWTIKDVLEELYRKASPDGSTLHTDMVLTSEGATRGVTGATLGLVSGEEYLDSDGNSRFYHPFMPIARADVVSSLDVSYPSTQLRAQAGGILFKTVNSGDIPTIGSASPTVAGSVSPTTEGAFRLDRSQWFAEHAGIPTKVAFGADTAQRPNGDLFHALAADGKILPATVYTEAELIADQMTPWIGIAGSDFTAFSIIPVNGHTGQQRGFTMRFDLLVDAMKRLGRMGEPEVVEHLLPKFGVIQDASVLGTRSTGLSVKRYTDLYNLHEARFAYNENPNRKFTAAHVGPSSMILPSSGPDAVSIGENVISTRKKLVTGKTMDVSARERYWTPPVLTAGQVPGIMAAFFPGVSVKDTSIGEIEFLGETGIATFAKMDRGLIARGLGSVPSMLTKVEKPVFMPAGKATPESVYASGVGIGAVQLIDEVLRNALTSPLRFANGYGGFTDFVAGYDSTQVLGSRYILSLVKELALPSAPLIPTRGSFANGLRTYAEVEEALLSVVGDSDLNQQVTQLLNFYEDSDHSSPTSAAGKGWASPVVVNAEALDQSIETQDGNAHVFSAYGGASLASGTEELSSLSHIQQWGYLSLDANTMTVAASNLPPQVDYQLAIIPANVTVGSHSRPYETELSTYLQSAFNPLPAGTGIIAPAYPSLTSAFGVAGLPVIDHNEVCWPGGAHAVSFTSTATSHSMNWCVPTVSPSDLVKSVIQDAYNNGVTVDVNADGTITAAIEMELYAMDTSALKAKLATYTMFCQLKLKDAPSVHFLRNGKTVDPHDVLLKTDVNAEFTPVSGSPMTVSLDQRSLSYSAFAWMSSTALSPAVDVGINGDQFMAQLTGCDVAGDENQANQLGLINPSLWAPGNANTVRPPVVPGTETMHTRVSLWTDSRQIHTLGGQLTPPEIDTEVVTDPTLWETVSQGSLPLVAGVQGIYGNFVATAATSWDKPMATRCLVDMVNTQPLRDSFAMEGFSFAESSGVTFDGMASMSFSHSYAPTGQLRALGSRANTNVPQVLMPDDPEHKMLFRPWRTVVDASVAKEQRLTFLNTKEEVQFTNGPLAIATIGETKAFRLEDLINAGEQDQFLLEPASSKTRMTDPSYRSILTFGRIALTDPTTGRHVLPDIAQSLNQMSFVKANRYASSTGGSDGGSLVYDRAYLRDLQSGRQAQRTSR